MGSKATATDSKWGTSSTPPTSRMTASIVVSDAAENGDDDGVRRPRPWRSLSSEVRPPATLTKERLVGRTSKHVAERMAGFFRVKLPLRAMRRRALGRVALAPPGCAEAASIGQHLAGTTPARSGFPGAVRRRLHPTAPVRGAARRRQTRPGHPSALPEL